MSSQDQLPQSWRRIMTFSEASAGWMAENSKKKSRVSYAIDRVLAQVPKLQKHLERRLEDIRVEHWNADDKGILSTDDGGRYQISKEKLTARVIAERQLEDSTEEFKITPYFVDKFPELSDYELDAFAGFVITHEAAEAAKAAKETAWLREIYEEEERKAAASPEAPAAAAAGGTAETETPAAKAAGDEGSQAGEQPGADPK